MNPSIHKQLPALLSMAHDRSENGRIALAGKISEVFLSEEIGLTHREESLVSKLIEDLLHHENPQIRQTLIGHFAQAIKAPRTVALRIVQGPIEIARSILAGNENLNDQDLVEIVSSKSEEHAAAVATRQKISEAVADALVTTGSLQIMKLVAENLGAKLSPKAMDVMIEAARLASILHDPIMARPELTADNAIRLYWWVEKDLRRATLERFGYGPGRLDAALDKAVEEKLNAHTFENSDDQAMEKVADWMEERDALTTRMLAPILRMGHFRLFNIALGRLNQLELPLIDLMVTKAGGRMMVALCRALNIDKGTFISIYLMARSGHTDEQVVHPRDLSVTLEAYERLKPAIAAAMVQSWRADPSDIYQRADAAANMANA